MFSIPSYQQVSFFVTLAIYMHWKACLIQPVLSNTAMANRIESIDYIEEIMETLGYIHVEETGEIMETLGYIHVDSLVENNITNKQS